MPDSTERIDYSFNEDEIVDFNPLEDFSFDDDVDGEGIVESTLEEGPFGLPNPDGTPKFQSQLVAFDSRETPEERIEALFNQMPTLQKMLFDILEMCREPISPEILHGKVMELKKHHHSVYSPQTFCDLLERAGAIRKTDADGNSLEEIVQEPLKVEIDGVEYWKVAPAPDVYWHLTDEGSAQCATYQPFERIRGCYEAEPHYAEIFTTVLALCSRENGASMKQIGDMVDDEPLLQKPKRYAMYFIDKLERAGAVEWNGNWSITQPGRDYLDSIESASSD